MSSQLRALLSGAVGIGLVLVASGCGGAAPSPSTTAASPTLAASESTAVSSQPAGSASAGPAAACASVGNITLNVLSGENFDSTITLFNVAKEAFEALNPNVKVNLTFKDQDAVLKTIKLTASADNPPDIFMGWQGFGTDAPLIKAGLIVNLDQYATQYGWDKVFSPETLAASRFSTDGTQFGTGSLWGLSPSSEYVGVFYNKSELAKIGITDPTTLDSKDAFEKALADAKAAGLTPIMAGDSEGWPFAYNYGLVQGWYVPAQASNDWVFGKPGSTVDDQPHQQAAAELQSWVTNGYFNSDFLGITNDDARSRFGQGEGVFRIDGNWGADATYKNLGNNVGWMLFPAGPSGKHAAIGTLSPPYHISSKSKDPDCAAAYLDFISTSPQAKQALLASLRIPAARGGEGEITSSNPLHEQTVSAYGELLADNGLMVYQDWATPTMFDLINAQTQLLAGGNVTPAQFTRTIQDDWDKFFNH
jgi:raffinose/stachyose/melibiose transport system substrate-binding protein